MRRYVSAPQNVASSRVPPCPKSRWRSLSPPYLSAKSHCFNCLSTCMQPESPITPLTMRQLSLDANPTPTRRQGDANVTPAPRTRAATSPYIFGHVSVPRPGKAALALHTSAGFGAAGPHTGRRSWGILSGRAARHDTPGTASDSWTAYRVRPQSAEWHGDIRDRRTPPQRTHRPPSRRRTNARSRR